MEGWRRMGWAPCLRWSMAARSRTQNVDMPHTSPQGSPRRSRRSRRPRFRSRWLQRPGVPSRRPGGNDTTTIGHSQITAMPFYLPHRTLALTRIRVAVRRCIAMPVLRTRTGKPRSTMRPLVLMLLQQQQLVLLGIISLLVQPLLMMFSNLPRKEFS